MCVHLVGIEGEEHVRLLTGNGLDSDLCRWACDQAAQRGEPLELLVACEECVATAGSACHPGGRRIADDGWAWSPVGMPTVWDIRAWLDDDVWESEDGNSRHLLCQRWYHWNTPMCWLDDERVAVSGIGGDDDAMLAGVRIFNAATGTELTSFAGPTGELFADAARPYAAAPAGLELWDPAAGQRTGTIPGFVPTHHHVGAGELAAVDGGVLRRWRT